MSSSRSRRSSWGKKAGLEDRRILRRAPGSSPWIYLGRLTKTLPAFRASVFFSGSFLRTHKPYRGRGHVSREMSSYSPPLTVCIDVLEEECLDTRRVAVYRSFLLSFFSSLKGMSDADGEETGAFLRAQRGKKKEKEEGNVSV